MHMQNYLQKKTLSSFANFLPEQLNLEGQWKVAISEISYPSMYQNVTERKFMVFVKKSFTFFRIILFGTWGFPFHYGYCWRHKYSHSRKKESQRNLYNNWSVAKEGSGLVFFSTDQGHIFRSKVGDEFGVLLRWIRPHRHEFAYDFVRIHFLQFTHTRFSTISLATQRLHCCVVLFLFRSSSLQTL